MSEKNIFVDNSGIGVKNGDYKTAYLELFKAAHALFSQYEAQLQEANKVINFYANTRSWNMDEYSERVLISPLDYYIGEEVIIGGQKARDYQQKYGVEDE